MPTEGRALRRALRRGGSRQLLSVKLVATMRAKHAVVYPRFAKEANVKAA